MPAVQEKTLLIGSSSRVVIAGAHLGFDTIVNGFIERGWPYAVVDRSTTEEETRVGTLGFRRLLATFHVLALFLGRVWGVRTVYIILGVSLLGFLRDALMIWSSRLLGRRIVVHLRGGGYRLLYSHQQAWVRAIMGATLRRVNTFIVLCHVLRDEFSFVPGAEQRIQVVPNGLPVGLQPPVPRVRCLNPQEPLRLLYLSNMIESKGYLDVLEACRLLHHDYQIPVQCDFCGKFVRTATDRGQQTKQQAHEAFLGQIAAGSLEGIAHYRGAVHGASKQAMLQQAHLLLLPTSYAWEGQPLSIIEALAFGVPVIATSYRGIPEQVIHAYNGYLVPPGAPQQIAEHVAYLWHHPPHYERLSQHALHHFQANFQQHVHLNRLLPIIVGHPELIVADTAGP